MSKFCGKAWFSWRRALLGACAAMLAVQACANAPAHAEPASAAPMPSPSVSSRESTRPNILLIISDDLNTRTGSYGGPALTPNIDRLAREGVQFDRAYAQFPWCAPSRASFLSGLRPSSVGVTDLRTPLRKKLPDLVTLPEYFRKSGYFTARSGKIFHQEVPNHIGTAGPDDPQSWDVALNPAGRDLDLEPAMRNLTPGLGRGSALGWLAGDGGDEAYTDAMVADDVIGLMDRSGKEGRPFFLAAGFYRPHTPEISPKSWFDLYATDKVALPKVRDTKRPLGITSAWGGDDLGMTDAEKREFIRSYYASTSYMDAQVGRILAALRERGLDDNTIIVFVSDHGFLLGEHRQWMKNSLWEQATRVPFIIRAPGARGNGTASGKLVELVDLYPTLVDLAGLPGVDANEGHSLSALLENPRKAVWTKPAFSQISGGRSVRSGPWRYSEWQGGKAGRELYNVDRDPAESRNLASARKYARIIAQLSALLPRETEALRPTLKYDSALDCLHLPANLPASVGRACDAKLDP